MSDNKFCTKSNSPLMVPTSCLRSGILDILGGIMYTVGFEIDKNMMAGALRFIIGIVVLYACLNCYHLTNYKVTMIVVIIVTILSALTIIGLILGLIVIYIIYNHKADFKS